LEDPPPIDYRATHKILWRAVENARQKYHESQRAFDAIANEIPRGLPHPDGVLAMEQAARERRIDHQNYMKALRNFSDFLTEHGER